MRSIEYERWDEYQWEAELRREDARVNAYLAELPSFVDLPEESDLVLKRLERKPELVQEVRLWQDADWDCDDDADEPGDDYQDRDGGDIYSELCVLSTACSRVVSSLPPGSNVVEGIQAVCEYGRLISWALDIFDLHKSELPALKIALCKRLGSGVNNLVGLLERISEKVPACRTELTAQVARLHKLRQITLDLQLAQKKNP